MRHRWVYINGEAVKVDENYQNLRPSVGGDASLWNDRHYDGLAATDGTPINSRKKHREYMKVNGLTTMDDFKGTWQNEAKARQERMEGKDPARKQDITRALHELSSRQRVR